MRILCQQMTKSRSSLNVNNVWSKAVNPNFRATRLLFGQVTLFGQSRVEASKNLVAVIRIGGWEGMVPDEEVQLKRVP